MYNNFKKAKNNSDPRDYDGRGESKGSNEKDIKEWRMEAINTDGQSRGIRTSWSLDII